MDYLCVELVEFGVVQKWAEAGERVCDVAQDQGFVGGGQDRVFHSPRFLAERSEDVESFYRFVQDEIRLGLEG